MSRHVRRHGAQEKVCVNREEPPNGASIFSHSLRKQPRAWPIVFHIQ
jgi:hypothetical protein